MSFLINKSKARFQPAEIVETTSYLKNVPWGWYHIYPFPLEKQPDFDELYWCLYEKEMLVHVVVDIGAYRDGKIPKEAQKNLADILSFFKENEKEMLLRVVYDREGQGLMREPDQIGLVEQHMQQLGEVFMPYHRHIRVMQGLLVGNWGEMHGSRFLSREKLRMLLRIWKEALGTDIPVAVRTPQQWRMLHEEDARPGHTGVGLFNDGMFGSDVDLGTYGWKEKEAASWEEGWCRRDELPFVRKIGRHIPYGGEAVGTASEGSLANAVEEMKCTGVSYLNAAHDKKRLELWKQSDSCYLKAVPLTEKRSCLS